MVMGSLLFGCALSISHVCCYCNRFSLFVLNTVTVDLKMFCCCYDRQQVHWMQRVSIWWRKPSIEPWKAELSSSLLIVCPLSDTHQRSAVCSRPCPSVHIVYSLPFAVMSFSLCECIRGKCLLSHLSVAVNVWHISEVLCLLSSSSVSTVFTFLSASNVQCPLSSQAISTVITIRHFKGTRFRQLSSQYISNCHHQTHFSDAISGLHSSWYVCSLSDILQMYHVKFFMVHWYWFFNQTHVRVTMSTFFLADQ